MGVVLDRGRRMASFLRGHTGSPLWRFMYYHETLGRGFVSPPGYVLAYSQRKSAGDAVASARAMKDNSEISGVLYSSFFPDPEDAVVILPIRHYALLLQERLDGPSRADDKKGKA